MLTMPHCAFALGAVAPWGHGGVEDRECRMEGKARLIFPILATGVVVFAASAAVTYVNIGFHVDFVRRWLSAYIVAWPVAAVTAFIAFPVVRAATLRIVALIESR
jgi:hypothetical protein